MKHLFDKSGSGFSENEMFQYETEFVR